MNTNLEAKKYKEGRIENIADALAIICEGLDNKRHLFPKQTEELKEIFDRDDVSRPSVPSRYKFPFAIWFRGMQMARINGKQLYPEPILYRYQDFIVKPWRKRPKSLALHDETSMVRHFRAQYPEYHQNHRTIFDWLCLMQHHDLPTRLLDWTENILNALYFAVRKAKDFSDEKTDGILYAINGSRLNEAARLEGPHRTLLTPERIDVVLRAVLAAARTKEEYKHLLIMNGYYDLLKESDSDDLKLIYAWLQTDSRADECNSNKSECANVLRKLSMPVAVLPNRINLRVNRQLGTFTIHGGKIPDPDLKDENGNVKFKDEFPMPTPLSEIYNSSRHAENEHSIHPFLKHYIIPKGKKRLIREQLKRIGIHEASLFPELEHQAMFVERQWKVIGADYERA